ncbi:PCSK5 convertase, partial [Polypterus senegalus]
MWKDIIATTSRLDLGTGKDSTADENGQERFLHRDRCRLHCPRGFYSDRDTFTCKTCMQNCDLCIDVDICTKCKGNYRLKDGSCQTRECDEGFFLDQEGSCVEQCPPGFFANPASLLCEECAPNCETCQDSMDNCLSCRKDGYSLFLYEGSCWSNCPDGYFGSPEDTCEVCDSLCLTCEESKSKCLSCVPYFYLENGQCTANCSYNYYPDEDGTCRRCPAHCDLCRDGTGCTECSYLYLLLDGICKATCPEGYFEDFDQGKCVQCHPTCATCSGTTYNDCDSCSIYYPKLYEGQCFEQCPDGTYELSSEQCQECDQTCSKCTGPDPTDCTKCKKGLALDPNSMMCGVIGDSECPPKMFLHEKLFSCIACHDLCESCHGQESYDCDTCLLPSYFYNSTPQGCLTCDWGSTLLDGVCYPRCAEQRYLSKKEICELCDDSCRHCFGPSPNQCLTCKADFALHPTQRRCITCCNTETNQTDCCLCNGNSGIDILVE